MSTRRMLLPLLLVIACPPTHTRAQTAPPTIVMAAPAPSKRPVPLPPSARQESDPQEETLRTARPTPFRITGTVLSAADRTPLAGIRLSAQPDERCPHSTRRDPAISGEDGRFSIALPCAGVWRLLAEGHGISTQRYDAHDEFSTGIVLTASSPASDVTFPVVSASSIFGFVTDEAGEPARNAQVLLGRDEPDGREHRTGATSTDDRGLYEFPDLTPGAYLVAVQTQPWYVSGIHRVMMGQGSGNPIEPELDVAYPLTWAPGVADAASATPIRLEPGAREEADVRLNPVPAIHLHLPAPPAEDRFLPGSHEGLRPTQIPLLQLQTPFGELPFRPAWISSSQDGAVDIAGLAPGTYLVGNQPYRMSRRDPAPDPNQDTRKLLTLTGESARTIDLSAAVVSRPNASLQPAAVSGTVTSQARPVAGAMVLLVPASANPEHPDPIRAQTNTDGSFRLSGIPPGPYLLVAVDHGWSLHYRDPATLAQVLQHSTPLKLTPAADVHQNLSAVAP